MGKFQIGHAKVGGRRKGAVNLLNKCEEMGIDVFEELLTLANDEKDKDKRFSKFKNLAEYLYAKPKDEFDISKLTPDQLREAVLGVVNNDETRGA